MSTTQIYQQARLSRDVRFDGKFYTAVITTGIFCRPVCPARPPKPENVRYYSNAMQAQEAGFRPCLRCLPELAPQASPPIEIKKLCKALESGIKLPILSQQFSLSERQIRRLFVKHYGLSPIKYLANQKLLLARRLLKTTQLSITDVAFASGYSSVRRFNEAIKQAYQCSPSDCRKESKPTKLAHIEVSLPYREPFDWPLMLSFFQKRQLVNVEHVSDSEYCRTISINGCKGWFSVSKINNKSALLLKVQLEDYRHLNKVIQGVRQMFDLDTDMQQIHQTLIKHPSLAKVIAQTPGLRLPGCWDIFEFSIRAILGQQISVKGATTLANRIAVKYGSLCTANPYGLTHTFPTADELSKAEYQDIGLTRSRISTLKNWLEFYQQDEQIFHYYASLDALEQQLIKIKGIGPWTVNYLAMRGLSDPDAFPSADLGIIKALTVNDEKPTNKDILALSEQWRPWRAYAAIYLWQSLAIAPTKN